jgi:hypothetical protein
MYATLWQFGIAPFCHPNQSSNGIPHEQQRDDPSPQEASQDPKTNGSIARNLYQGDPQLRAGLAIHTTLCGTADVFFGFADG